MAEELFLLPPPPDGTERLVRLEQRMKMPHIASCFIQNVFFGVDKEEDLQHLTPLNFVFLYNFSRKDIQYYASPKLVEHTDEIPHLMMSYLSLYQTEFTPEALGRFTDVVPDIEKHLAKNTLKVNQDIPDVLAFFYILKAAEDQSPTPVILLEAAKHCTPGEIRLAFRRFFGAIEKSPW